MGETAGVELLCLDSDPALLRYLSSLFADLKVYPAADADAAADLLRSHPDIGVLVLDSALASPGLLEAFLGIHPEGLIVWLSQHGGDGFSTARADSAVFRTLQRPFREGDLVQTVQQAVALCALRRQMAGRPAQSPDEMLVKRAEQLAELNRLKDELVMIAAHDIRAPLSVILGYCDILLVNEPGVSESGREILVRVQASANRLLAMVNNVLNLAALDEGRMELRLVPTRLSEVVRDVMDSLAGMIDERRVECRVDISGDEATYQLDRVKVTQVLQNLVSNAIKFNRPGGTMHISAAGTPEEVAFEVRDTGRGMTPEQAERAFDKFVRFASGSATGSGLGLAIAKGFVELHGGKIQVETRRDEGSTFRFTVKPGHHTAQLRPLLQ